MKVRKILYLFIVSLLVVSCASTNVKTQDKKLDSENEMESEIVEIPEPTPEELFIDSLSEVKIQIIQSPKVANYKKDFSSSFKALVTDKTDSPLANFPITVTYPSERNKTDLVFSSIDLITDSEGIVEFTSEALTFGVDDFVTFYPTPAFNDQAVINACKNLSAKAEIKAKSAIMNKGALLFVWDFNEKDRPVNNSYEIMSEIRSYGITMVGNAPVNESSDIGSSLESLYKRNYEIVEDAYGYLICGSVKFVEPVAKVDDSYKCSLVAEITVLDMKNGEVLLEKTYNHEALGKNWSDCTGKCKDELSVEICKDFIFGL